MASVPEAGKVYPLLGRPQDSIDQPHSKFGVSYPEYLGASFDASTTNFSYSIENPVPDADPLTLTLSFLSPITPSSTLRQSLPAAYLTVLVEGSFDVNVYIDVNGEWVSGNRANAIAWEFDESPKRKLNSWKIRRLHEQLFTEFADHSEWGTLHFSGPPDVSYQAGTSAVIRQLFVEGGKLQNHIDRDFRPVMDREPVFAYSKSFRLSRKGSHPARLAESAVFTFALIQDPVVQFASARGLTFMKPLWASAFRSADEMIHFHYSDFHTAAALANNYSTTLGEDAFASGAQDYQDIAALSARQVLGATQFSGTLEAPIIFLKEISSNGNFQTIDVIFPAFPFFLYTNPKWLAYLLEPLIEHQLSGQYPNDYSMHDIGSHFPNATGHPDGRDEYMPVEECGNMLIMGLALVNAFRYETEPVSVYAAAGPSAEEISGLKPWSKFVDPFGIDITLKGTKAQDAVQNAGLGVAKRWVRRSYKLWKQWTGYLVDKSLIPQNQLCTDDFAGWLANQTNLALKGITGIRAMSELASLIGREDEAVEYRAISEDYIDKWQEYGISRDKTHAKLAYTWYGSWTTIYNLYADSLLCFHLTEGATVEQGSSDTQKPIAGRGGRSAKFIPDKIYTMHSDWYHAVRQRYGLPLDSRHLYTKSDWEFFAAAVTSRKTRTEILDSIALWINETSTGK